MEKTLIKLTKKEGGLELSVNGSSADLFNGLCALVVELAETFEVPAKTLAMDVTMAIYASEVEKEKGEENE